MFFEIETAKFMTFRVNMYSPDAAAHLQALEVIRGE